MTCNISLQRTLSAFKPSSRSWTPVSQFRKPVVPTQTTQTLLSRLSLITQNLDAFSSRRITRARMLLDEILKEPRLPDVVFLQEVAVDVHADILGNPKVRDAFLVTDAEDQTSFEGVPFANMTLLSRKRFAFTLESQSKEEEEQEQEEQKYNKFAVGPVSRVSLPSKYGRCALVVDIIPPSTSSTPTSYRLVNVHLDSLWHTLPFRAQQLKLLANLLREPGCGGGVIAGDFNAISPDDHTLVNKNGLVDAWVALHGHKMEEGFEGATWGVGQKREDELKAGRLDKVAILGGVEARDVEILHPPFLEVPKPGGVSDKIPCSDHCGLRLGFTT